MLRNALTVIFSGLLATATLANESNLRLLQTGDDSRGWEAVGRLNMGTHGTCTGALIAPDLVLTAAHCLYNQETGDRIDPRTIEFLAGWRNGRAMAYRMVRRAAIHPEHSFSAEIDPERVYNDVAVLKLDRPIRHNAIVPFETDARPSKGARIGVVSYGHEEGSVPVLQEMCSVLARQSGVLIMSCHVDFGSSGAPVFSFDGGVPRIVSVVSAKAQASGQPIALGTALEGPLAVVMSVLEADDGALPVIAERTEPKKEFVRAPATRSLAARTPIPAALPASVKLVRP